MSQYKSLAVNKKKTGILTTQICTNRLTTPHPKKNFFTATKIKKYSLYNRYTDKSLDEIKEKTSKLLVKTYFDIDGTSVVNQCENKY